MPWYYWGESKSKRLATEPLLPLPTIIKWDSLIICFKINKTKFCFVFKPSATNIFEIQYQFCTSCCRRLKEAIFHKLGQAYCNTLSSGYFVINVDHWWTFTNNDVIRLFWGPQTRLGEQLKSKEVRVRVVSWMFKWKEIWDFKHQQQIW